MKILVVIHKKTYSSGSWHWCYDVLYKPSFFDKLFGRKPFMDELEYECPECPYVAELVASGWKYFISGDTAHIPEALEAMGLKDEHDLEGLVKWLKNRYHDAMIIKVGEH